MERARASDPSMFADFISGEQKRRKKALASAFLEDRRKSKPT
jgi:hypothetical protein